jgi:hypothetical protein
VSVIRRTRTVAQRGLKIQRRVVLTQALFWPVVLGTGLAIGAAAVAVKVSAKRGAAGRMVTDGHAPTPTTPTAPPAL